MPSGRKKLWRYVRGLAAPVLLLILFVAVLIEPLGFWLHGEARYDEATLREWIDETRIFRLTLSDRVDGYLGAVARARAADAAVDPARDPGLVLMAEQIQEHLDALGVPSKIYPGQLPLFPLVYRLELRFETEPGLAPISWDSALPRHSSQYRVLEHPVSDNRARLRIHYELHAYNRRHANEQAATERLLWMSVLALVGTVAAILWVYLVQRREREREQQRAVAQHQIDKTERLLLEEELRRQEAEVRHEEAERRLLEQRLATQAAEGRALELKSQLYASIGIMAGSYAHNIKNLLVRPNDLLRRCIEGDRMAPEQQQMLHEVRDTLGTVTERLQQILRTVRRDPSRSELARIDLNGLVRELYETWQELAREKWKLTLTLEAQPEPLWVEGDLSHLQQAVENLLFNARDATFEMRNHLRDQARRSGSEAEAVRQALIAAAGWKGNVMLRTRRDGDQTVLEVQDNGIGMTEEVRRRCTETHFSTKRDNAIYEGNSTGMGLGLSFVVVILEHHGARLEIESEPLRGTTFRVAFRAAT